MKISVESFSGALSDPDEAQAPDRLPWSIEDSGSHFTVFTSVLWMLISTVSALGLVLHYERPRPRPPQEPAILAQQIQVELTREEVQIAEPEPMIEPLPEPAPPDALVQPAIAQPITVAKPSPAISFLVPVESPNRIVEAKRADHVVPAVTKTNSSTGVAAAQPLVFGQGEGKQPQPEYPDAARRLGQEGTVVVQFMVGQDGRVLEAEAKIASPWPLLNQAALRAVRERWRFSRGALRIYEVSIRFKLK